VLFTDPRFLFVFLPIVLALYFLLHAISRRASMWVLVGASAVFIARDPFVSLALAVVACHAISGIVDVNRGDARASSPIAAALYVIQFPLLVGGPLVRYAEWSGQLAHRVVSMGGFSYGVRRFVTGLVKVLLVANILGAPADRIFLLPADKLAPDAAWLAAVFVSLQIYFLFSGYADMGIGLGRILGFRHPENFRRPYTADSVREFWRRWNVTLMTWLRDYLYLPIVGHDRPTPRLFLNIVAGFCLIGLWHRAGPTVFVFGLYTGTFLAIEAIGFGAVVDRLPRFVRHVYVLLVVVVGWVILRADSLAGAGTFLKTMAGLAGAPAITAPAYMTREVWAALVVALIGAGPLVPSISRWRVSLDAGAASAVMMLAATALFIWRPIAITARFIWASSRSDRTT
jgi:alginate O-acetyltransferase complex protein AlgI